MPQTMSRSASKIGGTQVHVYTYHQSKFKVSWGSIFGGSAGGGTLKLCRNICLFYLLISKNKTGALVGAKQKINIWRVHFGGVPWGVFPNDVKTFVS